MKSKYVSQNVKNVKLTDVDFMGIHFFFDLRKNISCYCRAAAAVPDEAWLRGHAQSAHLGHDRHPDLLRAGLPRRARRQLPRHLRGAAVRS